MNINKYFAGFSGEYLNSQHDASGEILDSDWGEIADVSLFDDGITDRDTGLGHVVRELRMPHLDTCNLSGGDPDDNWYQAEVVGEEAVGGQTPTPDQNVTEGLLLSMGLTSVDGEPVQTVRTFSGRDLIRWELDPDSAEDHQSSREEER